MAGIPLRSCTTDSSQCGWECGFSRLSWRIPQKITGGVNIFVWLLFVCVCVCVCVCVGSNRSSFFKGVASDGIHNCGRREAETSFFRIQQDVYAKIQYKTDKAPRYFTVRIKEGE